MFKKASYKQGFKAKQLYVRQSIQCNYINPSWDANVSKFLKKGTEFKVFNRYNFDNLYNGGVKYSRVCLRGLNFKNPMFFVYWLQ